MNKKSFFFGVITGVVLTIVVLYFIGSVNQDIDITYQVKYLDNPVSYEEKTETSFEVFQVLGNAALANERTDKKSTSYYGNTVLIMGENYYCDQIVKVKNPQRIGTYSYTNKGGRPMTVPVIEGEIE